MKLVIKIFWALCLVLFGGCGFTNSLQFDQTYSEQQAGYSYIPLEPSTVAIVYDNENGSPANSNAKIGKTISKAELLNALPDNSVRIATRQTSGKVEVGIPSIGTSIGSEGNAYEVIIDFVNTQTVNKSFAGKWLVDIPDYIPNNSLKRCYPYEKPVLRSTSSNDHEIWSLRAYTLPEFYYADPLKLSEYLSNKINPEDKSRYDTYLVSDRCPDNSGNNNKFDQRKTEFDVFNIPVYVGIGLRLKANVTVLKGNVNLSSLPSLVAAVSSGNATGTMSVQTIGISGKSARTNLLLLDKIDSTTIQNAIQVLASIKSSIESDDTIITPRIVGFHNTIGAGPQGVNTIHSLLTSDRSIGLNIDPTKYATGSSVQHGS